MPRKKEAPKISDLIDTESGRIDAMWQTMKMPLGWTLGAFTALGLVVIASTTDQGTDRLAELPDAVGAVVARANVPNQRVVASRNEQNLAILRDEARRFATDRMKMEQRIAELERNVGDITGSIPQPGKVSQIPQQQPPLASIQQPSIPQPLEDLPAQAPRPLQPLPKPVVEAAPTGQMTIATRSQFGADIGQDQSLSALRTRWQRLVERHGGIISSLEPVVSVREGNDGKVTLHLVIGPMADVSEAASLCARLRSTGTTCTPGTYDGQRLALR